MGINEVEGGVSCAVGGDGSDRVSLRGRQAELETLRGSIDGLASGRGGTVLISGVAGVGKSALLAAAGQMAEDRGMRVFSGAGDPAVHVVPLGPLLDALVTSEDPPVDADALLELSRSPDQRFWLMRELQERLERTALHEPILIALDDIHWADAATLSALSVLPRHLASHRILWLIAFRREGLTPEGHEAVSAMGRAGALTLSLGHLEDTAVVQIVGDLLGAVPDAALLQTLERVGGQPFLLVEMLRGLLDEDRVGIEGDLARLRGSEIPRRFLESVEEQLQRLSGTAREAVQMASILGRRFSVEELAGMIGRSPTALLGTLHEVLGKGLIAENGPQLEFRHDLVREAIHADLPEPMRRSLQRRAIEVMREHGAPPADFAALVIDVAEPGDRSSIDLLRRAAAEVGRVSPSVAVPLSRRALELARGDGGERATIAAETLTFLVDSGRAREAEALLSEVSEDLVDPVTEVGVRLHIGLLLLQYLPAGSVEQCRQALSRPDVPAALRIQLLSLMSRSYDLLGDLVAAEDASRQLGEELRGSGDAMDEMMALVPRALVAFAHGDWHQALERAAGAVERQAEIQQPASRLWASSAWQTLIMLPSARLEEAFANIAEGMRSSEEEGLSAGLRVWSMLRCRALLAAGRLSDGRAEAQATVELSDESGPQGSGYINHVAGYVLGSIALHTGSLVELQDATDAAARMNSAPCPNSRRLGAWLSARLADADESLAPGHLDVEMLDPLATGHLHAGSARQHSDSVQLVRMLLRVGQKADATVVAERLEGAARREPDFPFLTAASTHARALLEDDCELALAVLELNRDDPRPLLRASALEDAGRLLSSQRSSEAVACLDDALAIYSAAGAERDVARVRRLLRLHGVRRLNGGPRSSSEWPELTKSELAVVRQVAHEATNREAAERLFLSPYTINSHLRHVFFKLGIRSRVELARLAAERQLPPP